MKKIGRHVHDVRSGLPADQIPIQIFFKSPMNLKSRGTLDPKIFDGYKMPVFTHATYVTNLGSELSDKKLRGLIANLVDDLQFLDKLPDGRGTVFHYRKGPSLFKNLDIILHGIEKSGVKAKLILENVKGTTIGDMYEVQKRYRGRLGFCFDSCHLFISGYDLRDPVVTKRVFKELNGSFPDLMLIHYNDSDSLTRDVHAVPGEGYIGNPELGGNPMIFALIRKILRKRKIPLISEING